MNARTVSSCSAVALLLGALLSFAAVAADPPPPPSAAPAPAVATPSVRAHRVTAYYFHTTRRCASCRALEAYSREAVETAFAEQLEDGRLVWRTVNVEIAGNEHFVKDYQLYTKSLILVNEVRGKPTRWKNLEKVWQLLQDKEKFLRYVQDEARMYLTARS
jgi:hypothetical protein